MSVFRQTVFRLLVIALVCMLPYQVFTGGSHAAATTSITETTYFKPSSVIADNWTLPCISNCAFLSLDTLTDQNLTLHDDDRETAYVHPADQGKNSLIAYNYSINLPSNANVTGIELQLLHAPWNGNVGYEGNLTAELLWNGRSAVTEVSKFDYLKINTAGEYSGWNANFKNVTMGSNNDTWGRIWSPQEFSNDNFGVKLSYSLVSGNDFAVDIAWIKLSYELLDIPTTTSDSATSTSNGTDTISKTPSSSDSARTTTSDLSSNRSDSSNTESFSSSEPSATLPLPFPVGSIVLSFAILGIIWSKKKIR